MCYIKNSSIWLCILTYAVSLRYELDVKIKTKQTGPIYPWTQINQLEECNPFPRYGHSSNEYAINKQVFIFGGVVEGKPQNDVFVIETNKLHAYKLTISGDIPHPRSGHTHINVGHNMIVESQNLCWKFISPSNYAPPVRAGHIACAALVDDIVYVFGGMTNDNKELSDLTAFRIKQLVRPCYGHIMTTADDKVFIFGGESTHSKGIIHILDTSKIKFPTGSYLNAFSQRQLLRRSSEPSISTTSPKFPTRETSSYTNEQNNNITIKNQKSIFRLSQITNLQGFITRPGGPKRRVKSPLEKVTESLPEIEENSTIDENLKISETFTNDEKIIEKEKFSESFDKVPTSNINLEFDGTNSNIGRTRNIKPAFDETQLQRPQDDQTVDQTPILLDNFHDNIPTISKHSNIVRDDDNFSNSSDRPKCYLERLQEQDFQIAEFKKRECWLKTQLELAKKNGYTPDSPDNELNDDIDTEKCQIVKR
ncbi:18083_t:CDS:2 [Gigaspora rosea]|nr:18083_t:CDS:2 [Gigaspora rosea]